MIKHWPFMANVGRIHIKIASMTPRRGGMSGASQEGLNSAVLYILKRIKALICLYSRTFKFICVETMTRIRIDFISWHPSSVTHWWTRNHLGSDKDSSKSRPATGVGVEVHWSVAWRVINPEGNYRIELYLSSHKFHIIDSKRLLLKTQLRVLLSWKPRLRSVTRL